MTLMFANQQGKYNVHMEEFRDAGKQQKLFFISDVSNILRSEEQNAWQSLVRVISHEINNSLAPIASISQTLKRFLNRKDPPLTSFLAPAVDASWPSGLLGTYFFQCKKSHRF